MENKDEKIWDMRKNIIIELEDMSPKIAEVVKERGYLVSAIRISSIKEIRTHVGLEKRKVEEGFRFYDFTCRQEGHMRNLLEYSIQLYDKFDSKTHPNLSV